MRVYLGEFTCWEDVRDFYKDLLPTIEPKNVLAFKNIKNSVNNANRFVIYSDGPKDIGKCLGYNKKEFSVDYLDFYGYEDDEFLLKIIEDFDYGPSIKEYSEIDI